MKGAQKQGDTVNISTSFYCPHLMSVVHGVVKVIA